VTGSAVAGALAYRIWGDSSRADLLACRYVELTSRERLLLDKFPGRTERYNEIMLSAVRRLELSVVDVDSVPSVDALPKRCVPPLD
jgi:hypothetical protein